jgi:arylsulfatase A-like enzyme
MLGVAMPRPPNFILLVGEDAGRALGCYGDPDARTPYLDQLAAEGCCYQNAFATAPVCAPSRSALVTGQYAWSLGNQGMRSQLRRPPRLFTHLLRDAGYFVNWANKTDFNFTPPADFADTTTDWHDALAAGGLPDQPFFLFHNIGITHESTMWPAPLAEGHAGFVRERLARRDRVPAEQRPDPARVTVPAYLPDAPEVRADIARFYEALALADQEAGRILSALDASPYRDNTIVLFLTDHGRGLAREKRWCYGAGVHLSLVIRAPGLITPGTVSDELVSWVDIGPTLLALAGVTAPSEGPGRVFLGPAAAPPRDHVFAGRDRMDECHDRVRVARDRTFHYIRNYHPEIPYAQRLTYMERMPTTRVMREYAAAGKLTGASALWMAPTKTPEELYDVRADPAMVHNLADDPAHAGTLHRLRVALDAELARYGDLGARHERELIAEDIVGNVLDPDYARRVAPLPASQQPEIYCTRLEPTRG